MPQRFPFPRIALALLVVFCAAPRSQAQAIVQDNTAQLGQVKEFDETYNERYSTQLPLVGATIPNVSAFDAQGKPFELESTRGKYTVLVFGCLT